MSHSYSQLCVPQLQIPIALFQQSHVFLHVFGPLWGGFQLTRAWALQATAREVTHLGPSPLLLTFSLGVQSQLTHG